MLRKFLNILILIVLIGGLSFGIYYFTVLRKQSSNQGQTGDGFSLRDFLPFGNKATSTDQTDNTNNTNPETNLSAPVVEAPVKMHRISNRNVIAVLPFKKARTIAPVVETTNSTSTKKKITSIPEAQIVYDYGVRFMEKTSGLVFEIMDNTPEQETRISDSITPVLGEGALGNNGSSIISRFTRPEDDQTIETYVGSIVGFSNPSKVIGNFLNRNIRVFSVSPDANRYFYMNPTPSGAVGIISTFVGNIKTTIFNSDFTEWTSSWTNPNLITIFPKPSGLVQNYVYSLNATTGEIKKLVGGLLGLTGIISPDGKLLAYSFTKGDSTALTIYEPEKMKGKETGLATFSEKCAFTPDSLYLICAIPNNVPKGLYPDDWYKGNVQFSDSFWKLDVNNQVYYLIVDTNTTGDTVDATNIIISEDGTKAYFINKYDGSLWEVDINN